MENHIVDNIMAYIDNTLSDSGYDNCKCSKLLEEIIEECKIKIDACSEGVYVKDRD